MLNKMVEIEICTRVMRAVHSIYLSEKSKTVKWPMLAWKFIIFYSTIENLGVTAIDPW